MKKRSEKTQKFLHALPIAGLVLLVFAMAALWAVALSYAIGVYVAWGSAMAFLTLFGLSFIGAGLCAVSVRGFIVYMRKVWYDRWPDAPGADFFMRSQDDADSNVKADKKSETVLENAKTESTSVVFKPKYITLQNIGYALLIVAVIFVIASAAMGSLDADKWVEARSDYLTSHGWYAESEPIRPQFSPNEVTSIKVEAPERKIIVRYDTSATMVTISCYNLYPDEYNIAREYHGTSLYDITVTRTEEPAHDADIDKMLDLCFQPNRIEKQVIITIPAAYRDSIEIIAENVIYAKE